MLPPGHRTLSLAQLDQSGARATMLLSCSKTVSTGRQRGEVVEYCCLAWTRAGPTHPCPWAAAHLQIELAACELVICCLAWIRAVPMLPCPWAAAHLHVHILSHSCTHGRPCCCRRPSLGAGHPALLRGQTLPPHSRAGCDMRRQSQPAARAWMIPSHMQAFVMPALSCIHHTKAQILNPGTQCPH